MVECPFEMELWQITKELALAHSSRTRSLRMMGVLSWHLMQCCFSCGPRNPVGAGIIPITHEQTLFCPYEGSTRRKNHSFELETKTLTHTQPHNLLWVPCALELTKARYCHWSDRSEWSMGIETTTQQWRCPDYFLSTLHKLELSGKRNCH